MTRAQRRKQNILNAQKSTGPVTDEGRDASRRNALKHGFTAQVVCFPDEEPEAVHHQVAAWVDALEPETHDEAVLAQQIAHDALKLQRLRRAEDEIVMEQVRDAETDWQLGRRHRVLDLAGRLHKDPARAVLELTSFAEGVAYLLDRWAGLKAVLESKGGWADLELIREALRVHGYDPDRLALERPDAYHFALLAVSCVAGYAEHDHVAHFMKRQMSPEWRVGYSEVRYTVAAARAGLAQRIDEQVALLTGYQAVLSVHAEGSRDGSGVRALALEDTPKNRLLVRYRNSTASSLDRGLKTFARLQSEREKADAAEAEESALSGIPNEAKPTDETAAVPGKERSYVVIDGLGYEVLKENKKTITLSLKPKPVKPQPEPYFGPDEPVV